MTRAAIATVFVALAAGGSAAGAGAGDAVYRVTVAAATPAGTSGWVEWIEPASGRWRVETGEETYVFDGKSAAAIRGSDVYVRTGSARFLGVAADRARTRQALRSYLAGTAAAAGVAVTTSASGKTELRFRADGLSLVATIEDITASAGDLFAIPRATSADVERTAGARPRLSVRAYWFGKRFGRHSAVVAVEHFDRRSGQPTTVYDVIYELPSAKGRSSAWSSGPAPAGEIQVVSQPVRSWAAQRAIQAFNGRNGDLRYRPWPRFRVRLRNGELVIVVRDRGEDAGKGRSRFSVITKTSLVGVNGSFRTDQIAAIARRLRPVA